MPPTSSRPTLGGRVQRDVRLQAALALLVGITMVTVPLFIWGRGRRHDSHTGHEAGALEGDEAGAPVVNFGDAGASLTVDAGGRTVTFGEPRYLKCQDPGPGKTAPERCDHLGPIEDIVTRAIAERALSCLPEADTAINLSFVVDVSFKRKKVRLHEGHDGSTLSGPARKKAVACIGKALPNPSWETIGHAHQRYVFQFLATFSAPPPVAAGNQAGHVPTPIPLGPP